MGMWLIILGLAFSCFLGGIFYLVTRIMKFNKIKEITKGSRKKAALLSVVILAAVNAVIIPVMGMMNAIVILLHFVLVWLALEGIVALWKRIFGVNPKRPHVSSEKRYTVGIWAVIISLSILGIGYYQAHSVVKTEYSFKSDKVKEPLKIVQFADSHIGTTFSGKDLAKIVLKMNLEDPDVILITGDFVDGDTTLKDMEDACRALGLLDAKYGVYFSRGNHDRPSNTGEEEYHWSTLEENLKANNVIYLNDAIEYIGEDYAIIGREVSSSYIGKYRKSMAELMEEVDSSRYVIVMDHIPDDYDAGEAAGVDLVLSGHTHGGQLFPITWVGEWIGANDGTYGHEKRGDTDFVITSGISDWAMDFKTGCRSEYVVINIEPDTIR